MSDVAIDEEAKQILRLDFFKPDDPPSQAVSGFENCGCIAKVLVVDDTQFNIIPVRHLLLEHFGIEIQVAENGQEAVDMFKELLAKPCQCILRTFRFIIMDLGMPVMDGKEATKIILKLAGDATLPG